MRFFIILLILFTIPSTLLAATLEWDANKDASVYQVYYKPSGSTLAWEPIGDPTQNTAFIIPLLPVQNKDYEFCVKAFNQYGNSSDFSDSIVCNPEAVDFVQKIKNLRISIQVILTSK